MTGRKLYEIERVARGIAKDQDIELTPLDTTVLLEGTLRAFANTPFAKEGLMQWGLHRHVRKGNYVAFSGEPGICSITYAGVRNESGDTSEALNIEAPQRTIVVVRGLNKDLGVPDYILVQDRRVAEELGDFPTVVGAADPDCRMVRGFHYEDIKRIKGIIYRLL